MKEMVFRVNHRPGGWIVVEDRQIGPTMDKASAVQMAEDMAAAVRRTGQPARVEIDQDVPPGRPPQT
jgi:hypothetical protein